MADTGRVKELTTALQTKATDLEGLSSAWKVEDGGGIVISTEQEKQYLDTVAETKQIQTLLEAARVEAGINTYLDTPDGTPVAGTDAVTPTRTEAKSLSDLFLESEAYGRMKDSHFRDFTGVFQADRSLHRMSTKDVFAAMVGDVSIPALGSSQQLPLQPRVLRPNRVRDLFPSESTTASLLYGIRETGFTNNAATVAQRMAANETSPATGGGTDVFGRKPKSNISLTTVTYPISTIAHLMDVHKHVLDDEPRLRGILDRDMVDGVKMVEDEEILYGDGVGENITGIINTAGVQTYTQGQDSHTTDKSTAAIRRAATRAMLAYFTPTGVILHPYDWEEIELETDDQGRYRVAVAVTIGAEQRLWRMNVVDTPAILQNKFLLGSFGQGARLLDRESIAVTVSTENRDNYERNVVTLRAEERIALEVPRPESFVYGTLTA